MAEELSASGSGSAGVKLSSLLEQGWRIVEEVEAGTSCSSSSEQQARVLRGLSLLQEASTQVTQLQLFSSNEDLEELSTADLRYLLLPALLARLQQSRTRPHTRLDALTQARHHFRDFLQRCHDYKVSHFHLPEDRPEDTPEDRQSVPPGPPNLVAMAAKRQAKIERYRQRKELEAKLVDVRRVVESGQADDEVSRDFYLLNIRRWITVSLEELESIDQEIEIVRNMDVLKQADAQRPAQPARPPMKPFILTKDAVQARVFGAGYPSLPSMTVDDWYEQHRKHGSLPDQGVPRRVAVEEGEEPEEGEEEDRKADNDDEEALRKARDWDDWKDSHRRGYGNRHNMG
ncbi:immunoglobulin-binding protein 1 [Cololabis saira]|uniref:immunoglobulin-binding protein 1 n=1 Tax=Cololabis saira TaxID=129043 RepID=UPI002AD4F913|nr:immunoglobulin-binding protein 1 [Cololabis saira]